MPFYNGLAYVPRSGKCQEAIRDRIIELKYEYSINSLIPSAMGLPISQTKMQALYFSYEDLPKLAQLLCFDGILDIYRVAGIQVTVPTQFRQIEQLCSPYPDEKLNKINTMIKKGQFGEVWWKELHTPADKMRALIQRFLPRQFKSEHFDFGEATEEVRRAYSHPYNAPSMDALPGIAKRFDVSLRWMLGLGPDGHLYGQRTVTEELYDRYTLLSPSNRSIVLKMLEGGPL